EEYKSRGSGFTLESIDGLLLSIYKYTPMSGSSYIELPAFIDRKRATISPQNADQQCFKWAILARHVTGHAIYRIDENYRKHEDKYNFEGITPLSDIAKFEKNNINVSNNVYGLEKKFQIPKVPRYEVYPLRVVNEEKKDHFDLLMVTDGDNSHYTYISNFSRLIRAQKTGHKERVVFCKRYFTSFDNQHLKYKLSGQEALDQHKLICGAHKPILPEMPKEGECLQFKAWKKTQRHPIVIYADFEKILMKTDKDKGHNTRIIHKHEAMSYGLIVKASNDIPTELMEEHEITKEPVIYRGSESKTDVAKHFIETVTELAIKIEKLLKTNKPIVFTDEQRQSHDTCTACNLCKINFTYDNHKVADHCHLSGKYRQALCNLCNLKLQTPNFVLIFFHNLSNYDAHLIVTELGHDTKAINVIPNSEEKFGLDISKIYFSLNTFMASGLSTLAKNLTTPGLENFCETAKHFVAGDMPLVTRKGVYPYEYTDSWELLKDRRLPRKRDFYSTLTETGVTESDFEHAKLVWDHFKCETMGEYSDLYLKIDELLLADVFENFRDVCMCAYNLNAAHYFTAPGLSFDAMLKFTGQKLEMLLDYDMLLMFENGIRGGLVQASKRYAKANNMIKFPGDFFLSAT
ncbi:C2H2-type domain-containing protein, partial [Aphis craccivora]